MANKALLYLSGNQDAVEITDRVLNAVESAVNAVIEFEKVTVLCEVSVTFVGDEEIRELNIQYRQKDKSTDVLSFPLGDTNPETGAVMLGDVIISAETAMRQAESLDQSFEREAAFLTVHSMLHLLGYDHETSVSDEEIMFRKQREIMKSMNL